ncbi:hypothetical protein GF420_06820 [candidate division GN15 bacterium]|nr:hypothetical protein [candidate division GN15 bacterium]
MHILTGMIIAALMGKKKPGAGSPLYGPSSPVRLSHAVPGRARFHVAALRRSTRKAEQLAEQLRRIEEVFNASIDSRTGSVLIRYNSDKVTPDLLAAAIIRLLGLEEQLKRTPQPALVTQARRVGNALNSAVYDTTGGLVDLWSLIPLTFVVLGVRKIMTDRASLLPTGVTMLWWAYGSLFRGGHANQ